MRRNQFSYKIESFGDQALTEQSSMVTGYVDGNSIYEVIHDVLQEINSLYAPDASFDEFIGKISEYSDESMKERRFGRTQTSINHKMISNLINGHPERE